MWIIRILTSGGSLVQCGQHYSLTVSIFNRYLSTLFTRCESCGFVIPIPIYNWSERYQLMRIILIKNTQLLFLQSLHHHLGNLDKNVKQLFLRFLQLCIQIHNSLSYQTKIFLADLCSFEQYLVIQYVYCGPNMYD